MEIDVLRAHNIHKVFDGSEVLHGVDFRIKKGEKVCLIGPSGSGKTTLLRCLNLLVEPSEGQIYFHEDLIGEWPGASGRRASAWSRYRARVAMVFQHFELFPHLTALQNIALAPRHVLHQSKDQAEAAARELLGRVGLRAFEGARPKTLSGGQKQRVAIARALAMQPDVILFDEPTSALDAEMVGEVLQLMRTVAQTGMTMVIVTHELLFARDVADRIIVMDGGSVVEEGTTEDMFESPRMLRSQEILKGRDRTTREPLDIPSDDVELG